MEHYKLISLNDTGKQYPTMSTAQHWLCIQQQGKRTLFSEKLTTRLTTPLKWVNSCSCARLADEACRHKRTRSLQLFLSSKPQEFVAIDVFETITKTRKNRLIIVMSACFSKLTRDSPVPKTSTPHVFVVVFEKWTMPYEIRITMMTDSGSHFAQNFITSLGTTIGTKLVTATLYHPPANDQLKVRLNASSTSTKLYWWASNQLECPLATTYL